ncbi:MAG: AMP-binding enzyme family protein [Rhodospirillales bacterium]|nr:AMP-binding enzyme family protein [Rhodospirillales bacterium]
MTISDDILAALMREPVIPLAPEFRSRAQEARLAEARQIEADGPDAYWAWVAKHFRWSRPWDRLREGGFGDLRYFSGGTINVADNCVDRHAENPVTAGRTAIIWEGEDGEVRTLTYLELQDAVAQLANGLKSQGIGKGDVVAIYLPNLPEAFAAIHACNRIGAIYTVLFAGFSPDAVALRLQTAHAKLVITADGSLRRGRVIPLLGNLRQARLNTPSVLSVLVIDRTGVRPALQDGEVAYETLVAAQSTDCPCLPLEANEPSFLIFTSGTEAKPKGLVHSVAGFLLGTWANVQWQINPEENDVYWCAADVGWLTFPIQAVIGGLAHGMTMLCYEGALDTPSHSRFYEIMERHGVTKLLAAPTLARMLRGTGDALATRHPLPCLRLISLQGEPLDIDTFHWTARHIGSGVPIINAYGQSETGSTWTYPIAGVDDIKAGSCGRTVPGHGYEILDDNGGPVTPGTPGNLVLTHPFPTLARTIWDDHPRYVKGYFATFPGRYQSSDRAILDPDGHLWVVGRSDDVINVAAHRISTMEIESAVTAQIGVAEAAVVGINDGVKGTVPVAFVVLMAGADRMQVETAVTAAVDAAIGGIAHLQRVYVTRSIPKTRAGKIMRRLLREAVQQGQILSDTTGLDDPESLDAILAAVAHRTP